MEKSTDITDKSNDIESKDELWDEIGFHKPMAGFWYNISLQLMGILISAILMGYLIGYFYPYPSSMGIKDVAFGFFNLMFVIFDIGTGSVMSRYIPEVNIKNPTKMLHYIQYFIWYQMITGLIQTTAVSIYAIFYASETTMAYTIWIMLIVSTTQYPGFLGVFRNVLDSLQYYDKVKLLNFLTGNLLQNFTSFLFVYLGRIWGEQSVVIGPILGIAIGAAIGSYVDDFFATLLSAKFFNDTLKVYGLKPIHCFHIEFTWEEIKPVLIFSLKTGIPGLINTLFSFFTLLIYVEYIPQYTTITFLSVIGGSIGDTIGWFGAVNLTPLISESYLNDKPRVTQYFIGQDIRFKTLIFSFWTPIVMIIVLVMPDAWIALNMESYVIAAVFIIPSLVKYIVEQYAGQPNSIMYGANKPNFSVFTQILQNFFIFLLQYFYFAVWLLGQTQGFAVTVYLLRLGHLPVVIIFSIINYVYVNRKIIRVVVPWKQLFLGFVIPGILTYLVLRLVLVVVYNPLLKIGGFFLGAIPSILLILICLVFVFFPLSGLFGGWDDINLKEFEKAARLSGPSKFLVWPLYRAVNKMCSKSKLHGKFAMESAFLEQDAKDLLETKRKNRLILKDSL